MGSKQTSNRAMLKVLPMLLGLLAAMPGAAQDACWPAGRPPPEKSSAAPTVAVSEPGTDGPAAVFFDASGSMAGYARPPAKNADAEPHYRSLVLLLPQTLASGRGQVDFFEFGRKSAADKTDFVKIADTQLQQLARPSYYCSGPNGDGVCRYQDSPVAAALNKIAEQPANALGLVVTDLFLSNAELVGTGGLELQLPLSKALREGRAIAVLAIKAASSGPVYDLTQIEKHQCYSKDKGLEDCRKNAPQYIGATSRPLFVIMIGPIERIFQFKQRLDSDLLKGIDERQQRFTIFARDVRRPASANGWPKDAFVSMGKAEKGRFLDAPFGGQFPGQQFVLLRNGAGLQADVSFEKQWLPGVPAPAALNLEPESWFQKGRPCQWLPQNKAETDRLVQFERLAPLKIRIKVAQPTPRDAGLFSSIDSYLVAGKIQAEGFQLDPWFGEWGYNEPDEMKVLESRPSFFPAKNLPRIGKVLSDILRERPEAFPLGEFRLGLKVQ